ncbi:TPA: hypothetical protein ACQJJO_002895 [Aeromonas veronii]
MQSTLVVCQPTPNGILEKEKNEKAQPNQKVELFIWRRDSPPELHPTKTSHTLHIQLKSAPYR